MPDKPAEMSLESRLIASLKIQRRKPLDRTPIRKPRIDRLRAIGDVSKAEVDRSILRKSRRVTAPRRAKKKALRFGRVPQNLEYLEFIRSKPCILLGLWTNKSPLIHLCSGRIEAAHTGPHGRGQKAADETALPMCTRAHRTGVDAHHRGSRLFWDIWGINREVLVSKHQTDAQDAGIYVAEGVL